MDQASIIRDLLHWLEGHLDQPLFLDKVAAKAGYSKWHLQRMFKNFTKHAIGSYIRARRLSKSAIALRLTSRPILDIALQYRFDSQQTFTRAFKKQFNRTPAQYRRTEEWDSTGICPPIRMNNLPLPKAHFVNLQDKVLLGVTQSYICPLDELVECKAELQQHFWSQYLANASTIPPLLYGLHHSRKSGERGDEQEILYTTAVQPEHLPKNIVGDPILLQGGKYVKFNYQGSPQGLQHFMITIYDTCVPQLQLTRRKGYDIEIFYLLKSDFQDKSPKNIRCEYLIPISL